MLFLLLNTAVRRGEKGREGSLFHPFPFHRRAAARNNKSSNTTPSNPAKLSLGWCH
jgi:hypothetical protein